MKKLIIGTLLLSLFFISFGCKKDGNGDSPTGPVVGATSGSTAEFVTEGTHVRLVTTSGIGLLSHEVWCYKDEATGTSITSETEERELDIYALYWLGWADLEDKKVVDAPIGCEPILTESTVFLGLWVYFPPFLNPFANPALTPPAGYDWAAIIIWETVIESHPPEGQHKWACIPDYLAANPLYRPDCNDSPNIAFLISRTGEVRPLPDWIPSCPVCCR